MLAYAVLAGGLVLYLGPFLIQVATSFKTDADAAANPVSLIPDPFTTEAWNTALGNNPAIDSPVPLAGQQLLRDDLGHHRAGRPGEPRRLRPGPDPLPGPALRGVSVLAVMAVPGIVLLIPKFLILQRLGMFDTYAGMIVPLFADAVSILLMKTAFEAVPYELEEAALIDGAGVFTRFTRIMLPLTAPALITVVIISFQGSWNEFTHFLVATTDPDLATLNLGIARLTAGGFGSGQQFPLKLALATLSTLPIAIVYLFLSRHFTRSIASTGIKG